MPTAACYLFIGGGKVLGGHLNTHLATDGIPRYQQTMVNGIIFGHDAVAVVGGIGAPATTIGFTGPDLIADSAAGLGGLNAGDLIHVRNETDGTNEGYYTVAASPAPTPSQIAVEEGGITTRAAGDNVTIALSGLLPFDATQSITKYDAGVAEYKVSFGSDITLMFDGLQKEHPVGGDPFFLLKDWYSGSQIAGGSGDKWEKNGVSWNKFASAFAAFKSAVAAWPGGPWTVDVRGIFIIQYDADINRDQYAAFFTNAKQWIQDLRDTFVEGPTYGSNPQQCPVVLTQGHIETWSTKPAAVGIVNSAMRAIAADDAFVDVFETSDLEPIATLPAPTNPPFTATAQHTIGKRFYDSFRSILSPPLAIQTDGDPTYVIIGQSQVNGTITVDWLDSGDDPLLNGPQANAEIWNQFAQEWETYNPLTNSSANGDSNGLAFGIDVTLIHKLMARHPGQTVRIIKFGWANTSLGLDQNLANVVSLNGNVKVDAENNKLVLESGTWTPPAAGRFVRISNMSFPGNNTWHRVDAAGTSTEIPIDPEWSSLVTEEADILQVGASVTVDAGLKKYTLGAGTWSNTPVAGQAITVAGFTNSANNGRKTVVSATTTEIVVTDGGLVNETATATIIGAEAIIDTARGTWDPVQAHLFEWAAKEVEKAKEAAIHDEGRSLDMLTTIWFQFENDAEDLGLSQAYEGNLELFRDSWRSRLASRAGDDMGFVIIEPFEFGSRPAANVALIKAAGQALAAADPQTVTVPVASNPLIKPKAVDQVHLTGRAILVLGEAVDTVLDGISGIPSAGGAESASSSSEESAGGAAEAAEGSNPTSIVSAIDDAIADGLDVASYTTPTGQSVQLRGVDELLRARQHFVAEEQAKRGVRRTVARLHD